jgi:signal transduction histidine kinase
MISAQMLSAEERDKKKMAYELHERLAQTLCAVKVRLEDAPKRLPRSAEMESIVEVLRGAIDDVRKLASGLRPSSLDNLGLLPTVGALCQRFEQLHPGIVVDARFTLVEADMPAPLKIVIYRIIELALTRVARHTDWDRVAIQLGVEGAVVVLEIDEFASDVRYGWPGVHDRGMALPLANIEERVKLSGGTFIARRNKVGGVAMRASWLRASRADTPADGTVAGRDSPRAAA